MLLNRGGLHSNLTDIRALVNMMSNSNLFLVLLSVVCLRPEQIAEGSRILISSPYGTKSYHNMYVPLATELARRGHHVTIITNYGSSELDNLDNVRQIVMDKLLVDMSSYENAFEAMLSVKVLLNSARIALKNLFDLSLNITNILYEDERIKDLMANDHFDLVMVGITLNAGSYPLAWHFKAPLVMLTPNAIYPGVMDALGDDDQTSFVPFFLGRYSNKMNLFERTLNTIATKMYSYFIHQYHQSAIQSIIRKGPVPDCPHPRELEKNISLVLTNTHPAVNYARPMPPVIVEVGAMHCRPAKPLPEDLETFVSHPDGFILFAVGSTLPMERMPDFMIQSFIKTFAKIPQRIIWQWKGKVRDDLPDNVLALPWLPQQDLLGNVIKSFKNLNSNCIITILGHENCKLFITHGGLNSIFEAVYHGVPILGLPFGTDQKLNMRKAVEEGYARRIFWPDLSQELLSEAIGDMLHNPRYVKISYQRQSFVTLF